MFRQLVGLVVMAVVLLPDWAAAFYWCSPPPVYPVFVHPAPCPPQFLPPPVAVCLPVVCCPVAAAPTTTAPGTPTIVPERMQGQPKVDPKKDVKADPPAGGFAAPVAVESPERKPAPPAEVTPAAATTEKGNIPPAAVPMIPKASDPPKPKDDLPKFELPPLQEPPKQPGTLPPLDLPVKADDQPKGDAPKPSAGLPAFEVTFPKGDGVAQPVEANKSSVSKASPLRDERRPVVDVYPVAGPPPAASALRAVGFVNKSDRDVLLTVNGKMTTLPAKNVLRADLPATFKWQIGGEPEREQRVPAAAPGVDVVIRK
jgi:hypothetical protein